METEIPTADLEALLAHIAGGNVVAREVDLATGAWSFAGALPTDECERSESRFTSIHGPRWRMLIIGASEIAHYLAQIATTVGYRVLVCDPREEYRLAWRIPGTAFVAGMPDERSRHRADSATRHPRVSTTQLDDMAMLEG